MMDETAAIQNLSLDDKNQTAKKIQIFKEKKVLKKSLRKNGRWTKSEHSLFVLGCLLYGNNWQRIKNVVKTRSSTQIRSHAQNS